MSPSGQFHLVMKKLEGPRMVRQPGSHSSHPLAGGTNKEVNIAPQQPVRLLPALQRDHPEDRETPGFSFPPDVQPLDGAFDWLNIGGVYRGSPSKRRQGEGHPGLLYPLASH